MIINFDMDGVLAKWNELASEEEVNAPGYFIDREVEPKAVCLLKNLRDNGHRVRILSCVFQNGYAENEKSLWLDSVGLGDVERIFVPYGKDKFQYVNELEEQLLIDDFGDNLRAWRNAGEDFIPIKFYNGINDRPKIKIDSEGRTVIQVDSWDGISINHRMSVKDMQTVVEGVVKAA